MSSEQDAIADVLSGYQPVDADANEHAAETMESVRELLEQRSEELQPLPELLESVDVSDINVIKPGDTVIFSTTGQITSEQAEKLKSEIKERLPKLADVIVMSQVRIEGIYREDEEGS